MSPEKLPALPRLVHRLLDEPEGAEYKVGLFRQVAHNRGKGKAPEKKAKAAVLLAKQGGYHAVVIVRDRDRKRTADRLDPIKQKRESVLGSCLPACAIGLAVETFDAWMIADGKAVGAAGGDAARSHPSPESLDQEEGTGGHPKDRAIELFGSSRALTAAYADIAAHVDLDLLEKLCPKGFAPFAEEVRERIGPVVKEESGS